MLGLSAAVTVAFLHVQHSEEVLRLADDVRRGYEETVRVSRERAKKGHYQLVIQDASSWITHPHIASRKRKRARKGLPSLLSLLTQCPASPLTGAITSLGKEVR